MSEESEQARNELSDMVDGLEESAGGEAGEVIDPRTDTPPSLDEAA